jgi:hypothetical protein
MYEPPDFITAKVRQKCLDERGNGIWTEPSKRY